MGAVHAKRWSLYILTFFVLKSKKRKKFAVLKKLFFGELNLRPAFWCKLKKNDFLPNFASNLLLFLHFLAYYTENEEFYLCLGCAAPKRWSKYTTNIIAYNAQFSYVSKISLYARVCLNRLDRVYPSQSLWI